MYVVKETRNETYRRLAKIAGEVGVDEGKTYGLLEVPDREIDGSANVGNKVTDDVKLMVKVRSCRGDGEFDGEAGVVYGIRT